MARSQQFHLGKTLTYTPRPFAPLALWLARFLTNEA